ncbi:transmembrane protein, putative [Bodo saltans]|uniref:Transmembrane protein, putative n=1 Tax=Bodo saltans TaxID=75058 RepID=A0A0S4IKJ4_BODSA|nr:transmembrane protein, putative [Bodo saltans]|eukprot:CUF08772.1 transmembrane protein, putative [Bodo saltans]
MRKPHASGVSPPRPPCGNGGDPLGIYRSGGLSRVVRCGATSGNITTDIGDNDSDDGALEVVVDMAQGHLIAVAVCVAVVVAIVLTATMLASHTDDRTSSLSFPRSVRRTLVAYHLPGRLVVMAVTLGPPLWEFGLALLLLKTESGLGVISVISGAALLILVSMVVTMFSWCNNFHARFEHHRNNFKLHSHGLPWSLWSTLSGVYESAGGMWVDTDDRTSFVKCYGEVFEDFTGGRQWYIALQCVLALCVGVPAAVSDAAGVNPTTFGRDCGVVQIIAGTMNMAPFMMLVLLRPYRAASNFAIDAVTELFGFIGGALVLRVGASNNGDNGPVANAADVILTIQFWLAIALAVLHVIHSAFLWYTRRGEVRGLCAGG